MFLTQQYQVNKLAFNNFALTSAFPFHTFYKHALGAAPFKRYLPTQVFNTNTTARTDHELFYLHRSYSQRKRFFDREYRHESVRHIELGTCGTLNHARHNAMGQRAMLVRKTRRLFSPTVTCKFWG